MRNNFKDEKWLNRRFENLVVLRVDPNKHSRTHWICKCDCGNEVSVSAYAVYDGHIVSCGCAFDKRRHGLTFDENGKINRLYTVWTTMRSRCNNPNTKSYVNYGGRGIKVCEEWNHYPNFYSWAISNGYDKNAPVGVCTLDRIDNDGNYCPENCRWVDSATQAKNKRPRKADTSTVTEDKLKVLIDISQMVLEGKSYASIGEKYGVSRQTIQQLLSSKTKTLDHII